MRVKNTAPWVLVQIIALWFFVQIHPIDYNPITVRAFQRDPTCQKSQIKPVTATTALLFNTETDGNF